MAKSSTNKFALNVCTETSLGVADTTWFQMEPNDISQYGSQVKTISRRPISKIRQYLKGGSVDVDSIVEYPCDMTMDSLNFWAPKFLYAEAANQNLYFRAAAMDATTGLQVSALTANQAGKLQFHATNGKTLIYCAGYTNAGNNGLHVLATPDPVTTDTVIHLVGSLVTETPPTNATAQLAGIQSSSNDLGVTVSGSTFTLTSIAMDFTTIGLNVGQALSLGGTVAGTQFNGGANGVSFGRVATIAAHTITGDKLSGTLVTTAAGSAGIVQLLYGRFVRNVSIDANSDDNRYLEQTVQFEGAYADLGGVGVPEYEYAPGGYANALTMDFRLGALATLSGTFNCQFTPSATTSRKSGASTPVLSLLRAAVGTAGQIASVRLTTLAGASAYFHNMTWVINNNVNAEKVIGTLGPLYQGLGILGVSLTGEALFTDPGIVSAIINAEMVTSDMTIKNAEGACVMDIPSLTLGGGKRGFPLDKTITVALTGQAYADALQPFGTSVSLSFIPVTP